MPILELCAGYGGLGIAVESLTGERVRYVAEIDAAASLILDTRFPNASNLGDIRKIEWSALAGHVNIITAGFPCQDISVAGRGEGINGARSGIWRDVIEAVHVIRPEIVFLENVAVIRKRGLSDVLGGLAEIGYDARWCCFRASGTGAPHHRDRWFCIAVPHDPHGESWNKWRTSASRQATWEVAPLGGGGGGGGKTPHAATLADQACFLLAYSDGIRRDGRPRELAETDRWHESADSGNSPASWWGPYLPAIRRWESLTGYPAPAPTEIGPRGGIRVTASFAEWMMGLAPGWVTGVPGIKRRDHLKAIGNGVCPAQAFTAYRHLLMAGP
ncbi:DNA cytosine methyltransferase [Streptomyces harbinensis]